MNKKRKKRNHRNAVPKKPADKVNAPYEDLAKYTMIPPPGESDVVFPYSGS